MVGRGIGLSDHLWLAQLYRIEGWAQRSETLVSLPRQIEFDAGGCPARRSLLRSPSLDFALRASFRLFQFAPGELVLRGQENVTKDKAARGLAAARFPALLIISGPFVQLARQKTASLKHALTYP